MSSIPLSSFSINYSFNRSIILICSMWSRRSSVVARREVRRCSRGHASISRPSGDCLVTGVLASLCWYVKVCGGIRAQLVVGASWPVVGRDSHHQVRSGRARGHVWHRCWWLVAICAWACRTRLVRCPELLTADQSESGGLVCLFSS